MARELITSDKTIERLKRSVKRLNDGDGLHIRAFFQGTNRHHWRFDYMFEGRRKMISFGVFPEVNLEDARQKAHEARKLIAQGIDPSDVRKKTKAEHKLKVATEKNVQRGLPAPGSFEDVARRWFDVKQEEWVSSYSDKVIRRLEMYAFPAFGKFHVREITPKQVLDVCRAVEAKKAMDTAHKIREHCSCVFRFAISEGENMRDPCGDIKGALKKVPVKHYGAITKPLELKLLLDAIYKYGGTFTVQCALRLTTMLMVRPSELRCASWNEFDLDNRFWLIPSARMKRTKNEKINGKPHLVPLPVQAVEILEKLFKVTGSSGVVFPSVRGSRFISENTINKAFRSMGYTTDQVTGHGFRATARTLTVELLGIPEAIVEKQLAHAVKDANGMAYNRTEFIEQRIDLMKTWADYLDDLRNGCSKIKHPELPEFKPVTTRYLTNADASSA
jgi:integrase